MSALRLFRRPPSVPADEPRREPGDAHGPDLPVVHARGFSWQFRRARQRVAWGHRIEIEARLEPGAGPAPTNTPWLELTWTGLLPAATPRGIRNSGAIPPDDWPGWTWLGCGDRGAGLPQFGPCYAATALVALECLPPDESPAFASAILEGGACPASALIAADRIEELGNRERADWLRSLAKARCVGCGGVRDDTWDGSPIPGGSALEHDWPAIDRVTPARALTMWSWCACGRPAPPPRIREWGEIGLRWPTPSREAATAAC